MKIWTNRNRYQLNRGARILGFYPSRATGVFTEITEAELMKQFLTLFLLFSASLLHAQENRPNFVVFLTDDLGWGDLACYGHPEIKTPHLDQFAKEGRLYTQAYSACGVCSPSRASVLTGRTPYRNGVWRWLPSGNQAHLRESEITIPELLKPLGYETMHSGKWHLNGFFNSEKQPQPDDHGYDWWFATQNNASPSHKNPVNFVRNGEAVGELNGFSAPLCGDEAIRWLKNERHADKPFFLTLWTHEPHLPIESDPKFMAFYEHIDNPGIRQHHGNVTQLDAAFGQLMKALDELGLRDNTFVIFTSDNGPEGSGKGKLSKPDSQQNRTWGSTGGLRGRKRDSHEGGIRVPAIVRWPGKIEAGTTSDIPIIGSDIFSTILDIVDVPLPDDRTIDGVSIVPTFTDEAIERKVPLFWRTHIAPKSSHAAMRIGDWKLVVDEQLTKYQLYKISEDWQEKDDLAEAETEKLEEMKQKFLEVWHDIEKEGPSEWWQNVEPKEGKETKKKAGKLTEGINKTDGLFDVVKGGTLSKSELGYLLDTSSQAIALQKLATPIQEQATFKVKYRSAAKGKTRNACFCFGESPNNADLYKVGTLIGMNSHAIFVGDWGNRKEGQTKQADFSEDDTFEVTINIDLEHGNLKATINGVTIEHKLPESLESVNYVGFYVKETQTEFTAIDQD